MIEPISSESKCVVTKNHRLFTINKFAEKHREQGSWPGTPPVLWAFRAGSPENGFGEVFVTVGRRVLVSEEKFWEAVARLQESKNVSN